LLGPGGFERAAAWPFRYRRCFFDTGTKIFQSFIFFKSCKREILQTLLLRPRNAPSIPEKRGCKGQVGSPSPGPFFWRHRIKIEFLLGVVIGFVLLSTQVAQFGPPVATIARQVPKSTYPKAYFRNVSPMPRTQQPVADKCLPVFPTYPLKRSIGRPSCCRFPIFRAVLRLHLRIS
jgi:hypothetical protein